MPFDQDDTRRQTTEAEIMGMDGVIDVTTPVNFDDEVVYECYLGGGGECKAVAFCCLCFWDIPVCDVCMLKGKKEIELKTFRILDLES